MKNKWNFSVSKVLMSSIAALLAASGAYAIPPDPCNPPKQVCCEKPAPGPFAFAYEKDLGISCPTNFYAEAALLLMQPKEEGLEYAIENSSSTNTGIFPLHDGDIDGYSTSNHHWDWNLGFRAGIGFTINHDAWNIDLKWTYLRLKDDTSDSIRGTGALIPLWLPPNVTVNQGVSASMRWSGDLNAFDLRLGKAFHVSRYLIMNPYFGIRAGWIDQRFTMRHFGNFLYGNYTTTDPEMDAENDFWGVGTRIGFDSEWLLNGGWKLFANAAAAILYGKFDVKQQLALVSTQIDLHHEFYTHVPTLDLEIGIAWGIPFAEDKYYFDLALAYEFHEWFDQNRMRRFLDSSGAIASNMAVPNGDLSFSGLSFKVGIDF